MRRRTVLFRFAALVTSQSALASQLGFVPVKDDHENTLYLVRTICIGKVEGLAGLKRGDHFLSELNNELAKKGFTVTKDVKRADAVLTGVIEIVVVLDGDDTIIPDDTLRFQLASSSSKDCIWSTKIKVRGQSTAEKDDKYKAQRLAEQIWKDWNKSAKRSAAKSAGQPASE